MESPEYAPTQSVETLYGAHHHWLQGWLRRRIGSAFDAADLAQDVFVRLLVKPRAFTDNGEARSFLRTVADGLCIDLWRRRELERAWLEVLMVQPEELMPSAEHQVMILQALYEIDAILAGLSNKAATAFVMAVGCGMTDMEVAAALGVSDRMVRKYVAQAMFHCIQAEINETLRA
jgi:RNA polymerase sigma factor (sigma-70 family)